MIFFWFCFSPSVMVSMDPFPDENKCALHKYPTFRVSSSIPSCTGTDSFAVIAAWITFYSVQEKPLLIRIIHTYTLLWKKILMNLHFPMKFIKKKKVCICYFHPSHLSKRVTMWEKVLHDYITKERYFLSSTGRWHFPVPSEIPQWEYGQTEPVWPTWNMEGWG